MGEFATGDKALWRGNIPVVIVDGYEGMPHKRTIKMDVDGDVFHWDVKVEELQRPLKPSLPQPIIDAYREYQRMLSLRGVTRQHLNTQIGSLMDALAAAMPDRRTHETDED